MSLVATYLKCSDGMYYKDAIYWGTFSGHRWFICFDDDDPPEIVIACKKHQFASLARQILQQMNQWCLLLDVRQSLRLHPPDETGRFLESCSVFFNLRKLMPVPYRVPKGCKTVTGYHSNSGVGRCRKWMDLKSRECVTVGGQLME